MTQHFLFCVGLVGGWDLRENNGCKFNHLRRFGIFSGSKRNKYSCKCNNLKPCFFAVLQSYKIIQSPDCLMFIFLFPASLFTKDFENFCKSPILTKKIVEKTTPVCIFWLLPIKQFPIFYFLLYIKYSIYCTGDRGKIVS